VLALIAIALVMAILIVVLICVTVAVVVAFTILIVSVAILGVMPVWVPVMLVAFVAGILYVLIGSVRFSTTCKTSDPQKTKHNDAV
jgi:hypothetical protein